MAGENLALIRSRLSEVAPYHPLSADTFADWALEAGDVVTISRDGRSYSSPVHSSTLRWRGKQEITLNSTGNREREPIAKVSAKKYARGGGMGAMINDQGIWRELFSEDGALYSSLRYTSSALQLRFQGMYDGLFSYLELTRSRMYMEFGGLYDGLYSHVEVTRSRLYADFMGLYDGLSSQLEVTRSRLYADFRGLYDGLNSQFEITRSRMYVDFTGLYDGLASSVLITRSAIYARMDGLYDGLSGELEITRSRLYSQMTGLYDGLSGELEITRSRMYTDFRGLYDGLSSQFEITRSKMYVDFTGLYDGLASSVQITRSAIYARMDGLYDGLSGELEITRSRLYSQMIGLYDGLSGELEVTRSRIYARMDGMYDGLSSQFEITRSRMHADFQSMYDGLSSNFEVTRSRMYVDFRGMYDGLSSNFEVTRSRMYVDFHGMYDGLNSNFEVTRSRMYADFTGLYDGLSSSFEVTRSRMVVQFTGLYDGLSSTVQLTRSAIYARMDGLYDGLSGTVEVTRSHLYSHFSGLYDGLSGTLEVTRSSLVSHYQNLYDNLESRIVQTSSKIALVVEGTGENAKIKPAAIIAAINDAGESVAQISANKIDLDGYVTVDQISAESLKAKIATIPTLEGIAASFSGNVVTSSGLMGSQVYVGSSGGGWTNISDPLMELKLTENTAGNTYTLQKKSASDKTWQDVGTFSRATSLSAGWDGSRTFTVSASPQGVSRTTTLVSAVPNADVDWDTTPGVGKVTLRATIDDNETSVVVGTVTVNKPSGGAAELSGVWETATKYTVTATSGEISGTAPSTTISMAWNAGKLTVSGTPNSHTIFERWLSRGTVTWNGTTASVPVLSYYDQYGTQLEGTAATVSVDASSYVTTKEVRSKGTDQTVTPGSDYVGFSSVTVKAVSLDNPTWNSVYGDTPEYRTIKVQLSNDSSVYKETTIYLTQGSWSGNKKTVYMRSGSSSGTIQAMISVDATDPYNNGQNSVTIKKEKWSGGQTTFSKSAGTASTKQVKLGLTGSWSGNTYSYTIMDYADHPEGESTGYTNTIDAPAASVTVSGWVLNYQADTNCEYKMSVKVNNTTYESGKFYATDAYNNGWADGYATVGIYPYATTTLDFGGSVTVYAQAQQKPTSSGKTNVASVTISAKAITASQIVLNNLSGAKTSNPGSAYYKLGDISLTYDSAHQTKYFTFDASVGSVTKSYYFSIDETSLITSAWETGSGYGWDIGHTAGVEEGIAAGITQGKNAMGVSLTPTTSTVKVAESSVKSYVASVTSTAAPSSSNEWKRTVCVRMTNPDTETGINLTNASATYSDYGNGWTAAWNKVSYPYTTNTGASFTFYYPKSTVGSSDQSSQTYTVSTDSNYAYVKNASGTTVARTAVTVKAGTITSVTKNGSVSFSPNGRTVYIPVKASGTNLSDYTDSVSADISDHIDNIWNTASSQALGQVYKITCDSSFHRYGDYYNALIYNSSGAFVTSISASSGKGIYIPMKDNYSITSTGTTSAPSGYAGFRSVVVPSVVTEFGYPYSGTYVIQSKFSGQSGTLSQTQYKLGFSTTEANFSSSTQVQVQNSSGNRISNTATLSLSSYYNKIYAKGVADCDDLWNNNLEDKRGDNKITANGTYYPNYSSGKRAISAVEVSVQTTYGSPTMGAVANINNVSGTKHSASGMSSGVKNIKSMSSGYAYFRIQINGTYHVYYCSIS